MPKYISLADGQTDDLNALFDLQEQEELAAGGRGRRRFAAFVNRAGQAVKKFGPVAAGLGITAVTGGAGAPVMVAKLSGAAKLIQKHGPNARGFLKGMFAARRGAPHQGPIPVAVPTNASAAEVQAAQEAADLLNNPNPAAFARQGSPAAGGGGINQRTLLIGAGLIGAYFFFNRK
jgi:hypothetical protein